MIRTASTEDIPALCRLMQFVQTAHAEAHPDLFVDALDAEASAALFARLLANSSNIILIAEAEGLRAGYLWCEDQGESRAFHRHPGHTGYIHHLSVDPAHRRHGHGRRLVESAVAALKARGATRVGVDYWSFNDRARTFFDAQGFAPQREVRSLELK